MIDYKKPFVQRVVTVFYIMSNFDEAFMLQSIHVYGVNRLLAVL